MKEAELPARWKALIERRVQERSGGRFKTLGAADFSPGEEVDLRFPDGSLATLRNALIIVDDERQELAVFTERCGHHLFPLSDLRYTVRSAGR